MGPFTNAILTKLAGELAVGVGGRLKRQITGAPMQQALARSLQAGLVAFVAEATAAEPDQEAHLAAIFDAFFHDEVVWAEVAGLVKDRPPDHDRMAEYLVDAGYDPETVPRFDLEQALDAFTAAYVEAAEWEEALHGVIQTARLRRQLDAQRELLAEMKKLVQLMREQTTISVRRGEVLAGEEARPIYRWQIGKYVAGDEVHAQKTELSGSFPGATIHIVNQYFEGTDRPLWDDQKHVQADLDKYLEWVERKYGQPQLRGIQKKEEDLPVIKLDDIYVSLRATIQPEDRRKTAQTKPQREGLIDDPEGEFLASNPAGEPEDMSRLLPETRRLVILGGPGSGKTTFLHIIASGVSRALLGKEADIVNRYVGLDGPLPLPIYISLGDYNLYRKEPPNPAHPRHGTLMDYISYALFQNESVLEVPKDFFERLIVNGRHCLLLLDGLDEIADEVEREEVAGKIMNLAHNPGIGPIIVTCRTRAYWSNLLRPPFRLSMVQPMSPDERRKLVNLWCERVYDRLEAPNAGRQLLQEIEELEEKRRDRGEIPLADTPLMVTIMAIVFYNNYHLPPQRAALYKLCTTVLLAEKHHEPTSKSHIKRLKEGGTPDDKFELLSLMAYRMMSQGKDAGRTVEGKTAGEWLRPLVMNRQDLPEDAAKQQLRVFLRNMIDRAALLDERGRTADRDAIYEFIHLSFQEFLCAAHMADTFDGVGAIVNELVGHGYVNDSWWRETILLTPGYMAASNRPEQALSLLRKLANIDTWDATALAATELAGRAFLEINVGHPETHKFLAGRLVALLTDDSLTAANPLRAAAGVALGRLGDPRPDVASDIPAMVRIPKGKFIMGSERRAGMPGYDDLSKWEDEANPEGTRFEVILPAYRIGKYPVTVAQFRRFVDEGKGYSKEGLWTPEGWAWRRKENITAPRLWDDPQWTVDNHPVVGVSWYEAVAYCAWLRAETGRFFRLPDEAMWEKAARGTDGRRWPWDDKWDASKLNSGESGIGRTSAVGIFPAGRSPYDVYDCAGNVLEWCSGPGYGSGANYPLSRRSYEVASYEEELRLDAGTRALRGGSWDYSNQSSRAAYRDNNYPDYGNYYVGFRVVELLSDPES